MKEQENLWTEEFIKQAFETKPDYQMWALEIAVALYPHLVNEFAHELINCEDKSKRGQTLRIIQDLAKKEVLAQRLVDDLEKDQIPHWEVYQFLLTCEGVDVLEYIENRHLHRSALGADDLLDVMSILKQFPRPLAYEKIEECYRLSKEDFLKVFLMKSLLEVAPLSQRQKLFEKIYDADDYRCKLTELVCEDYIYQSVRDEAKDLNKFDFNSLWKPLNRCLKPCDFDGNLLLQAAQGNSSKVFRDDLLRLAEERQWDLENWQKAWDEGLEIPEFQKVFLWGLDLLTFFAKKKQSTEIKVKSYLIFNVCASLQDQPALLEKADDKAACALNLLGQNQLYLDSKCIDALVEADPALYEQPLLQILEEDKRFISIANVCQVFKEWCNIKPDECFASVERLIDCLTEEQGDFILEDIGRCLRLLGARTVKEIAPRIEGDESAMSIYLRGALGDIPTAESLQVLMKVSLIDGVLYDNEVYPFSNFLHPDLLNFLAEQEVSVETAELIDETCKLHEIDHPLLEQVSEIIEEQRRRRENLMNPLENLYNKRQGIEHELEDKYLELEELKEEKKQQLREEQLKKKKAEARAKSKAKKQAKKKQRKK